MTTGEVDGLGGAPVPHLAQRLFLDFGDLRARAIFRAIGRARRILHERGETLLDPQQVEELARGLLRAQARPQGSTSWFA